MTLLPRLRFRMLLAFLVAAVLLPSLTFGIIATYREIDREGRIATGRLLDSAEGVAAAIGSDIRARVQAVEMLATGTAFDPGADPDATDQALRRASAVLGEPLAMIAPDGRQIVHTAVPRGLPIQPTVHIAELQQALQTARPVVLDAHIGVVSHAATAAAMVPVKRDDRVLAVIAIRLEIDPLRDILAAQHIQRGSVAYLVDSRHRLLAQSNDRRGAILGEPAVVADAPDLDGHDSGLYRDVDSDGARRVVGFHSIPGVPGWLVFVTAPAASIDAAWPGAVLLCATGGALALALGGWLALIVARHVLRPLERLRNHALAVAAAQGEMVADAAATLPPAQVAELEALRAGFVAAEDALHRRATAEQRISQALLSSEARLTDLMETVDLGVFMARDMDGTIQHWSAGCEELYGFTALEAVGQISHDLLSTRFPTPLAKIEATLEAEGSWVGELWHRTRDGRELIVNAHKILRHSPDGREAVLEVLTDMTAQRQAEATLGAVLEALPVGVLISDAQGRIFRGNAAIHAIWGGAPETASWEGYGAWAGYWPETGERIKAHEWGLARALRQGETVRGELVDYERFDTGERGTFINNAAPVRDAAGNLIGGVAAALDVTEARRAEALLAASEAQLRTLFETVPVGLILAEFPSGRIVGGNAHVETLLRHPVYYSADVDSYDEWVSFHADGTRVQGHEYPLARMALAGEENPSIEVQYQRGDGTRTWIRIMGRPVRDAHGRMIGGVVVLVDIDIERRAQQALEQLVQERTRALEETEARLAQAAKMEALGRLAGGVAHDFNNILQVVQGSADMAVRRLRSEPERAEMLLDMVADAATRGMSVTGRLLAFARRGDLSAEAVVPEPLLEGLMQMLRHTMGPTVELRIDAASGTPPLVADRGQLETVLVNLANNARDALPPEGGVITLAASLADQVPAELPAGQYVRLSVADTGAGMTPSVLARVSEPFFTTKPKGKGTGLGLAMARGFVEQSGGTLRIDSAVGQGTTVSLWLPVVGGASAPAPLPQRPREATDITCTTVLLVDDNADVRAVLGGLLEDQGHAVIEAVDGEMALQLLDGHERIDVLMTDLAMPGIWDGFGLIQEARQRRAGLPVILVTGHLDDADFRAVHRASAQGGFAVLRKPISSKALQAGMEAVLRGDTAVQG